MRILKGLCCIKILQGRILLSLQLVLKGQILGIRRFSTKYFAVTQTFRYSRKFPINRKVLNSQTFCT